MRKRFALFSKVCNTPAFHFSYAFCTQAAAALGDQIKRDFDPGKGKGWSSLDMNVPVATFSQSPPLVEFPWPDRGTWAFGGDPTVPHHVSLNDISEELLAMLGESQFAKLVAFGEAMTDSIGQMLPEEERFRMKKKGVSLGLDFAEIRVEDGMSTTPGGKVHIDWERGESMVLVIPLQGNSPTIYPEAGFRPSTDGHAGYLITGLGRWNTFHSPTDEQRNGWVTLNEYGTPIDVPEGMVRYRDERAKTAYPDMYHDYPGLFPTVHRGGTGARKVLILNFSHMKR
jgi:hypothetical protein